MCYPFYLYPLQFPISRNESVPRSAQKNHVMKPEDASNVSEGDASSGPEYWWGTFWNSVRELLIYIADITCTKIHTHPFHSIHDATALPGPWPAPQDASIQPYFQLFSSTLLSPAAVTHPSGPQPSIWFLVFPLVLWCRSFRLKLIFGILSFSILTTWPAQYTHIGR